MRTDPKSVVIKKVQITSSFWILVAILFLSSVYGASSGCVFFTSLPHDVSGSCSPCEMSSLSHFSSCGARDTRKVSLGVDDWITGGFTKEKTACTAPGSKSSVLFCQASALATNDTTGLASLHSFFFSREAFALVPSEERRAGVAPQARGYQAVIFSREEEGAQACLQGGRCHFPAAARGCLPGESFLFCFCVRIFIVDFCSFVLYV